MGRRPRTWDPDFFYHLIPKGSDDRPIFDDDVDRMRLMTLATAVFSKHGIIVSAYCLMTNHAHFLVRCGDGGLSRPTQDILGGYSRWTNRRHARKRHLFQNHCYAERVEDDAHLMVAAAYIELNPVGAGIVESPESWRWSSYRAHAGLERPHALLANDTLLGLFGDSLNEARDCYRQFVLNWQRDGARRAGRSASGVSDTS
jgi:REP element-mobilizing transposase RayT